ncbi:hypothetical protein AXF42_Ash020388 [Apostasia shenzhenica]|uniref:J domain-containing protein n=1 Tax=Apostasia shenzhenica TaxID=1088818 RepID=A0A2I0A3M7_9ASPA|nr:hypothetical protein AXF42_Ash020388 [Apostasia shenzhenica]
MSRGHSPSRNQSRRRTLARCQIRGNAKNAIIIDEDKDSADVVLLENPIMSHGTWRDVHGSNFVPDGVIDIEDEEEEISSGSSSTAKEFSKDFSGIPAFEESDHDECLIFDGNINACDDCAGPSRNHYGLCSDSESNMIGSDSLESLTDECDDSEGNNSDCEIEDQSGNIRKQWEKAAARKKERYQASLDQPNLSGSAAYPEGPSCAPNLSSADLENDRDKIPFNLFQEMLSKSRSCCPINVKECQSFVPSAHELQEDFLLKPRVNKPVGESGSSINIPFEESGMHQAAQSDTWEEVQRSNFVPGGVVDMDDEQAAQSADDSICFPDKQVPVKASLFDDNCSGSTHFSDKQETCTKASFDNQMLNAKEVPTGNDICQDKMVQDLGKIFNRKEKQDLVSEHVAVQFNGIDKKDSEESSASCNEQQTEAMFNGESSNVFNKSGKKIFNADKEINGILSPGSKPDGILHDFNSLIGERERHKETDEYKRVAEEEWASRQRQLQIQAEEAQKLRKRRKAENLRLLDMEKRQKKRLEEIRESQKKNEETTQLKEQIQLEVRNDLEKIEMRCRDMASVLRALGIHVKGAHFPMAHEVNAAYRQALVRFHPDRASRTDIRQQVEAEEKFKLISRLKEKLLL